MGAQASREQGHRLPQHLPGHRICAEDAVGDRHAVRVRVLRHATLYNLNYFLDQGLVKPPLFVQTVFGLQGGTGAHPEDVLHMKRTAERLFGDKFVWSVLGAGRNQLPIAAMAAAMGGNIRVGLEDSLWAAPGRMAASNAEQVTLARKIIEGLGLEVATADEAREILDLKGGDKLEV